MSTTSRAKIRPSAIHPCLWFDHEADAAARFYVSLFAGSRVVERTRHGDSGAKSKGSVLTVTFELAGHRFVALNGGPHHRLSEAFSLMVFCDDQRQIDHLWRKLSAGGEEQVGGWLKDRFGLSWQIVPSSLWRLLKDRDARRSRRVMAALCSMKKVDVAALERAFAGTAHSRRRA